MKTRCLLPAGLRKHQALGHTAESDDQTQTYPTHSTALDSVEAARPYRETG